MLYARDLATLGEVTTVALYLQLLLDPLDRLLGWLRSAPALTAG